MKPSRWEPWVYRWSDSKEWSSYATRWVDEEATEWYPYTRRSECNYLGATSTKEEAVKIATLECEKRNRETQ